MGLAIKDKVELFMRLIEGDFPDYTKVIPKAIPTSRKSSTMSSYKPSAGSQSCPVNAIKESSLNSRKTGFRYPRIILIWAKRLKISRRTTKENRWPSGSMRVT